MGIDKFFLVVVGLLSLSNLSTATPDSAGIVEMVNGLAYGGIPYGSVSGMVAKYSGYPGSQGNFLHGRQLTPLQPSRPIIITPNVRAVHPARQGPVQIYNLPGVVAPGVLGTISQIGY